MRPWVVALAGAVVVLLALLALVLLREDPDADLRGVQARRAEIQRAAEQQAVNVTSLTTDDPQGSLERVRELGTGDFRKDHDEQATRLRQTLEAEQIRSQGRVVDAAVLSADRSAATVLVVVDGTVANASAPEPQPRRYRMQLGLERVDGRWLTSSLSLGATADAPDLLPGNPSGEAGE